LHLYVIFAQMLRSSYSKKYLEAGCDEAGRGCLAGPVVAAAVILPTTYRHKKLNDSKQLTREDRFALREEIQRDALAWAVAEATHQEVDEINILNASFLAMHRALEKLAQVPELILVDGNRFKKYRQIPHHCIVKGDGKFLSIAAASVLAKTARDEYMEAMAQQYPGYFWETNKGYPTKQHRDAIRALGLTPLHRRSFQLLPPQLELFS
jgi:ribonuclease HII